MRGGESRQRAGIKENSNTKIHGKDRKGQERRDFKRQNGRQEKFKLLLNFHIQWVTR
jgi:hypothetical protein